MMRVWQALGVMAFWVTWPGLYVYLKFSHRSRVLIIHDDSLLLVKSWLGAGKWSLPGGGLHRGETAGVGAVREVAEETGIRLRPDQLKLLRQGKHSQHGLGYSYVSFVVVLATRPSVRKQRREITAIAWIPVASITENMVDQDVWETLQYWRTSENLVH